MVAFEYDNGAVGSLYYSREVPSLLQGLRLSKLLGRGGIITFESNGVFVLVRGEGFPRILFPGFRDIRGYQAMYRDFHRSIREGPLAGDEPRSGDGRSAPHGSDLRQSEGNWPARSGAIGEPSSMQNDSYDIVIIGTAPVAAPLRAHSPATERASAARRARRRSCLARQRTGVLTPCGDSTRYRTTERWLDDRGEEFRAVHALLRRREHEVLGQRALSPASRGLPGDRARRRASRRRGPSTTTRWRRTTTGPNGCITCTARRPRSDRAPAQPVPVSAGSARRGDGARLVEQLRAQGLHPSPLPLGLINPGEAGGCVLCRHMQLVSVPHAAARAMRKCAASGPRRVTAT